MKNYLFAMLLILSTNTQAQTFFSAEVTTKESLGFSGGYITKSNIEFKAGYARSTTEQPNIFYTTVGYKVNLSSNEKDNYNLTTSLGVGDCNRKIFDEKGYFTLTNKTKPLIALELGKDLHLGRYYMSLNYCGDIYAAIGMRILITTKNKNYGL